MKKICPFYGRNFADAVDTSALYLKFLAMRVCAYFLRIVLLLNASVPLCHPDRLQASQFFFLQYNSSYQFIVCFSYFSRRRYISEPLYLLYDALNLADAVKINQKWDDFIQELSNSYKYILK